MKEKKDVMSVKDVAEYYGVSQTAVYRLRDENKLHQLPLPGVKFGRQEVEALAGIEWEYSATGYRRLKEENSRLEADEKSTEEFTNLLKGMGATQEQAAGMATYGIKYAQGVAEAVAKNLQEQYVNEVKSWGDAAKEKLGGAYQETLGKAATARDYIEQKIPGFTQMLNLTGAGNHIAMIKTMAAFADLIGEDPGKMGGAGTAATSTDMYPHTDFSKY